MPLQSSWYLPLGTRRICVVFGRLKSKTAQRLAKTRQYAGVVVAAASSIGRIAGYFFATPFTISGTGDEKQRRLVKDVIRFLVSQARLRLGVAVVLPESNQPAFHGKSQRS
jgi:hypothetical protein